MIVNPQVFNYRLTIGTLVVALVAFTTFSFFNYRTVKSQQDFLVQEKKLLHNELNEFIDQYDEISLERESLKEELSRINSEVSGTNDVILKLETNANMVAELKTELQQLKRENRSIKQRETDLLTSKNALNNERNLALQTLELEQNRVQNLIKEKEVLENSLSKARLISANSFKAKTFNHRSSNKVRETSKASEVNKLELSFVINENALASKGTKNLYVQVIGPDNNVIADKGAIEFGEASLIYSAKTEIEYSNEAIEVHTSIKEENAFKKGRYYISVFENDRKLGSTQILLN